MGKLVGKADSSGSQNQNTGAEQSKADNNEGQFSALPSKTWLSNGVELLFERNGLNKHGKPFDVVIVGSGYGGAIAASELSKASKLGLSICLLERGREFLPGSFPASMDEAPTEFRTTPSSGSKPKGNLEGLYDIRLGNDLNIVQANGLGGGSLINAGVMARANDEVFENSRWPSQINGKTLKPYYDKAELALGSVNLGASGELFNNTIELHNSFTNNKGPAKYESLKQLALGTNKFRNTNITVNMVEGQQTSAGLKLNACNLCGDCASGCNNNSKISLDKNLLVEAVRNGVEVFTGASVLKLSQNESDLWQIDLVFTDSQLRSRQAEPQLRINTTNVLLSAGALGSTEILKRSQNNELKFSEQLGHQFSSNGDMLAVGFYQNQVANAIANADIAPSKRGIGPTITGMIDFRDQAILEKRLVIQEMAVPAAASHFFGEVYGTVNSIQTLWSSDKTAHQNDASFDDHAALSEKALQHTSLYAVMGNDGAKGKLWFKSEDYHDHEGTLQVDWPMLKEHELFDHQIDRLTELSKSKPSDLGGEILSNPVWQLLKPEHMNMMKAERGAPMTVHPLGGCPMGESERDGATNHLGQPFRPNASNSSKEVYKGLFVLDGSIIPEAVGINPALTISAVAFRAIEALIQQGHFSKNFRESTSQTSVKKEIENVPIVRSPKELEDLANIQQKETQVQITERLVGFSRLENDAGQAVDAVIELTIWSRPLSVKELSKYKKEDNFSAVKLEIDNELVDQVTQLPLSKLRLYLRSDWEDIKNGKIKVDKHEIALDQAAKFIGQIEGHLTAFARAESYPLSRIIESGWGWMLNRGLRDLYQVVRPKQWESLDSESGSRPLRKRNMFSRLINLGRTLSRAGEIRTLNYDITIQAQLKGDDFVYFGPDSHSNWSTPNNKIIGVKKLTYERRANPWTQLAQVSLQKIPKRTETREVGLPLKPLSSSEHRLERQQRNLARQGNTLGLDMNYLTKAGTPLIRITQQQNQVRALMDLVSLGSYMTRMLLGVHFYSFRAPDSPKPRQAVRLAGIVNGLPEPTIHRLTVDRIPDNRISGLEAGQKVEIVLTHYRHENATKVPVMMLHGYSDNSALFVHSSMPNSLAKVMYQNSRDVWLVDLRTSSALSSSRYPWKFETVSNIDIPKAVEYIYNHYEGKHKIDVIAHCMGAVMLGMSILQPYRGPSKPGFSLSSATINRIVFSQATPTVVFTQDNNFKSFATNYLKEMIPNGYQFQVQEGRKANQILDRFLYTLPYPRHEFDIVNAPLKPSHRAEFARTRHRVDALFSRTFELANLSSATLEHIDDFFGPMHLDTIVQASRFARYNVATDADGNNSYVSRERLQKYWSGIPTMSFHSRSNGLVDVSTGERTKRIFMEAGLAYTSIIIDKENYGHQDSITGVNAHLDVFPQIIEFLDVHKDESAKLQNLQCSKVDETAWVVEAPACGPIIIRHEDRQKTKVMLGSNSARACKPFCIFLPVFYDDSQLKIVGSNAAERLRILEHYVELSMEIQNTQSNDDSSRWHIAEIPNSLLSLPNLATDTKMDGLAALMVYDDLVELDDDLVVGSSCNPATEEYVSSLYIASDINQELQKVITKVVANFFQSNRNVLTEFAKSVIEYEPQLNNKKELCFSIGSCQYPAGMLDKEVAYDSYKKMNQLLDTNSPTKPQFLALIGDQIYADATAGFLDPTTKFDRFVQPYYQLYKNQEVRSVLRRLPLFAMLDDHELSDNWEPVTNNAEKQQELDETLRAGVDSFLKFQRGEINSLGESENSGIPLWYSFSYNEHNFFMLDTRTERSARTSTNILHTETTIMSANQHNEFENWLINTNNGKPKFILSSSILLPRHTLNHASENSAANCIRSDGWDGYPVSLYKTLALIVDNKLDNLVFLSGDEHIGCYAEIDIHNLETGDSISTVSAHCPGLYTPFPFANARIDDFEGDIDNITEQSVSQFNFEHRGTRYQCKVRAKFNLGSNLVQLGPIKLELCGGFLNIQTI